MDLFSNMSSSRIGRYMRAGGILLILAMIMNQGCGVPQSEYDKLRSDNEKLMEELDECQNGADKLVAAIEKSYKEKDYENARKNIGLLYSKHPESPKNTEYLLLIKDIERLESEEKMRKEAELKEKLRMENLRNTGIWEIAYYIDQFGNPTKQAYIKNRMPFVGTFSNYATQNSPLNVVLLISTPEDICIVLYEYAGKNPVKSSSWEVYDVEAQSNELGQVALRAANRSDRLSFDKANSKVMHSILTKGGRIQFYIQKEKTPTTQYRFTIDDADWYDNAYNQLAGKL